MRRANPTEPLVSQSAARRTTIIPNTRSRACAHVCDGANDIRNNLVMHKLSISTAKLQKKPQIFSYPRPQKTNNHTIITLSTLCRKPNLCFSSFHFLSTNVGFFYPTSMRRDTLASCLPSFGSSNVSTPSTTRASIFSLSTSSGNVKVCSYLE